LWNPGGDPTVNDNNQSYHIYRGPTGTVTVEAIFIVQSGKSATLTIDEILPANFNGTNVSNQRILTLVSASAPGVAVSQSGNNISFSAAGAPDLAWDTVAVTFTVNASANLSIWNYRVTSSSDEGNLFIMNVIVGGN
jgi:hypothetical protein